MRFTKPVLIAIGNTAGFQKEDCVLRIAKFESKEIRRDDVPMSDMPLLCRPLSNR